MEPGSEISLIWATGTKSLILNIPHPFSDRLAQGMADTIYSNAIEYLLEEAGHDHADRFLPSVPAAHRVEELFVIDTPRCAAVRASNVVCFDLQTWNRVRAR